MCVYETEVTPMARIMQAADSVNSPFPGFPHCTTLAAPVAGCLHTVYLVYIYNLHTMYVQQQHLSLTIQA